LPITGSPFSLNYRSSRTPEYQTVITIPVIRTVPLMPRLIRVEVQVAGQAVLDLKMEAALFPKTLQVIWDGKDGYGRLVYGEQPATVTLHYLYEVEINDANTFNGPAGSGAGAGPNGPPIVSRRLLDWWWPHKFVVGKLDARAVGLGGWTLSEHHQYDPVGKTLHLGDGSRRSATDVSCTRPVSPSQPCRHRKNARRTAPYLAEQQESPRGTRFIPIHHTPEQPCGACGRNPNALLRTY